MRVEIQMRTEDSEPISPHEITYAAFGPALVPSESFQLYMEDKEGKKETKRSPSGIEPDVGVEPTTLR